MFSFLSYLPIATARMRAMKPKQPTEQTSVVVIKVPKEYAHIIDNELTRLYKLIESGTQDKLVDWATKRIEYLQDALINFKAPASASEPTLVSLQSDNQ